MCGVLHYYCLQCRSCTKFTCMEWAFVIIATATMAGILGMSIERFVVIHRNFGNETPDFNESWEGYEGSGNGSGEHDRIACSQWICLNDFTFAVLILVNWRKCIRHGAATVVLIGIKSSFKAGIFSPLYTIACFAGSIPKTARGRTQKIGMTIATFACSAVLGLKKCLLESRGQ